MAAATPVEAPNNLVSNAAIRIVDIMSEGPVKGFVLNSGPYGSDPLTSTLYDNVVVRNLDGSFNFNVSGQGYAVFYTYGTTGQTAMTGFDKVENILALSSNTQVTNPPIGAGNVKNVTATFNTTSYPDADSIKVTINVPALYAEDNNGNINGYTVQYAIDISLNNGSFVNFDEVVINGKCTSPYLFTTIYTLPKTVPPSSFYQWTVRVRKTNVDILSTQVQNTMFVNSIGVVSASSFNYPNTALVGTFIGADQFSSVPNRAYLIDGLEISVPNGYTPTSYDSTTFTQQCDIDVANRNIGMTQQAFSTMQGIYTGQSVSGPGLAPGSTVTYVNNGYPAAQFTFGVDIDPVGTFHNSTTTFSGTTPTVQPAVYPAIWTGDFQTGVWTNNPAWILYDILTNSRYGLGDYIQPGLVDKWSLYQIAQYCDEFVDAGLGDGSMEPRFTCNVNITSSDDAYNLILNLASVFRGMVYFANGAIFASQTSDKSAIVGYTNANVIKGQFSYADSARNTRSSVALVRYNDPNNYYRQNTAYIEDTDAFVRYGYIEKQAAAFACTSLGQAYRLGQWILTAERTLTETISFQVGLDSLNVKPGDVFNVYDNFRNNQNGGGRIVSFDSTRSVIQLDRPVTISAGYNYTLTAAVPAFTLDGSGSVTGSDQIAAIHNSQIQTISVTTSPGSGLTALTLSSGFATGIFNGSPWLLSVTGGGTIFNNASIYQCLSTTESQPGIIDIVGLQFNTGIFVLVDAAKNLVTNAVNSGDPTPILAPTNFSGILVTGLLSGSNQYYEYLNLTWTDTTSTNLGYYSVSGDEGTSSYVQLGTTRADFFNYFNDVTGKVDFTLCAVSNGGVYSSGVPCSYTFPGVANLDTGQFRAWLLPDGYGDLQQVGIFYNRPDPTVSSTRIFFATGLLAPFTERLDQSFYPALGVLASGLDSTGTTAYFSSVSFDMSTMASQSAIAQGANTMMLLVENELMSVGELDALPFGNQYQASITRGALGTFGTTHSSNISGWMFYNADLSSFADDSLVDLFDSMGNYNTGIATRYFQVQNLTQNLVGPIQPAASPWIPYTLPNPAPDAPNSLSAQVGTGKIVRLTWTAPDETNILEYRIYRATGPGYTDQAQIGTDLNTYYDDIAVTLGTTYEYWVTTVSQDEEESEVGTSVFATPNLVFPSGVNLTPPVDPSPMTLAATGAYFGADGALYSYMEFNVPQTTGSAAFTNVYVVKHGVGSLVGGTIGAQLSNTGQNETTTIYDLTPGTSYDVGSQSVSNFGVFSDIVLATNSPFIGAATNPVAGQPGSPPATPTLLQASGGLGGVANFIALTWKANTEANLEEYGVYRNGVNSAPPQPMAYVGANSFVDANVTGNNTYYYWVSAFNRSEQQSALTASVNAITQQAPAAPSAITLNASGYYNAKDGTVFVDFTFNVPALTLNAVGQQLQVSPDGIHWSVENDLTNTTSTTSKVNDLVPGQTTYFGLNTYSLNGASSAITPSSPASFLIPSKTVFTRATPPSSLQIGPAGVGSVPARYLSTTYGGTAVLGAITGTWVGSPDPDIVFYEYTLFTAVAPSDSAPVNYQNTVPASQLYTAYYTNIGGSVDLAVRAINSSNGTSTWTLSASATSATTAYAGNLGAQNDSATQISQLQIGSTSNTSVTKIQVLGTVPQASVAVFTPGGTTANNASGILSLVGLGFNTAPDFGSITVDGASHAGQYRLSQSSSTWATFTVYCTDGSTNITNGETFNVGGTFQENA